MARKETAIEDALFQIKNLEEALNRNAQGILSSTMKEEISSLVKESLKEQDEVDTETETEVDVDNEDDALEVDDTDVEDIEIEDDDMMAPTAEPEDDTIDLTQASDEEVLKVFKAMGDNDGVIVKKDDNMLHLSDNENDTEYLIRLSESDDIFFEEDDLSDADFDIDGELEEIYDFEDDEEDEFGFDDEFDFDELDSREIDDMPIRDKGMVKRHKHGFDDMYDEFSEMEASLMKSNNPVPTQETIYEIEMDDDDLEDDPDSYKFQRDDQKMRGEYFGDMDLQEYDEDDEDYIEFDEDDAFMFESKKSMKPKGVGMGSASKFKYNKKPNQGEVFKTKMKQGTRGVGMGKAKFEYKEEVNGEGFAQLPKKQVKKPMGKKAETKEASRTYGNGSKEGRGLRKGITPNRNLTFESKTEELDLLRAKNDEYRKALDLFRTKLNEVAIFNSNLAYATRLFTEHSTTKQEKINILRRFDNVDTLKESKNLYRVIKSELGTEGPSALPITESVQRTVERTPSTGSAVNLIESKTYENPQFLRMKDLMTKIK
jgi:hypothetical protein